MSTIQRTAVLTGATSDRGIGITTARRYASQGWGVVILDLDGEKSAKVAADIGNGQADFAAGLEALAADGYTGHFSLELETRDVTHGERPAAAAKAASFIIDLI